MTLTIGFAKPKGGTGGYARYIAIAPEDWEYGYSVEQFSGAPLPQQEFPLKRDENGVMVTSINEADWISDGALDGSLDGAFELTSATFLLSLCFVSLDL